MRSTDLSPSVQYEAVHCTLTINRPADAIAVVVLTGSDIGEFADVPMRELAKDIACFGTIELFVDARGVKGASIEVSSKWAFWMSKRRAQFKHISMLTGSRYVQITAEFVRRFAGLTDLMQVYSDSDIFDKRLRASINSAAKFD